VAALVVGVVGGGYVGFRGDETTEAVAGSVPAPARVAAPRVVDPPGPIPGYLLIADRGNNRVLLVNSRKHVLWRYPRPGDLAAPFRFDDDAFFSPGFTRVISNQEDQNTIQVVSFPQGRLLWFYGHVNVRGSSNGYLNTPDDAYLLPNGLRTVADAYNCRVLFITPGHRIVRSIGQAGVCAHDPPRTLGAVNGATPLRNGDIMISEINGSWIDDVTRAGALRWAFQAPVSYPSDPQPMPEGRILLADYTRPGAALIVDHQGRVVWRYGPSSGPGMLDHPSLALPLGHGLIAINDDYRDRVVLVSLRTRRIVWQYGVTDTPGTGPNRLNTPDGMDLLPTRVAVRSRAVQRLVQSAVTANCGTSSIGPGAIVRPSSTGGARCFLAAYRNDCRPATYRLSMFGVDTIATRDFRVVKTGGACVVAVTTSFHVVPQPAHVTGAGTCRKLRVIGTNIVADSCTGHGLPARISLTAS
jgi:hypothetical protein